MKYDSSMATIHGHQRCSTNGTWATLELGTLGGCSRVPGEATDTWWSLAKDTASVHSPSSFKNTENTHKKCTHLVSFLKKRNSKTSLQYHLNNVAAGSLALSLDQLYF